MNKITPRILPLTSGCEYNLQGFALPECDPSMNFDPVQQIFLKAMRDADQWRLGQIKTRLEQMGFRFTNDWELNKFMKERMTLARFDDEPDWRELYLDYGTDRQILVASWWETMEFNTFTDESYATMGKITFGNGPKQKS